MGFFPYKVVIPTLSLPRGRDLLFNPSRELQVQVPLPASRDWNSVAIIWNRKVYTD